MKPTQEQVIAWAREARLAEHTHPYQLWSASDDGLERFAALVYEAGRKDENEACAKVCEGYQDAVDRHRWPNGYECAAAIRARREQ